MGQVIRSPCLDLISMGPTQLEALLAGDRARAAHMKSNCTWRGGLTVVRRRGEWPCLLTWQLWLTAYHLIAAGVRYTAESLNDEGGFR